MRIAIRPDGSWWDIDDDGPEGDCDDVLRVEVPDEVEIEDVDEWALKRVYALISCLPDFRSL